MTYSRPVRVRQASPRASTSSGCRYGTVRPAPRQREPTFHSKQTFGCQGPQGLSSVSRIFLLRNEPRVGLSPAAYGMSCVSFGIRSGHSGPAVWRANGEARCPNGGPGEGDALQWGRVEQTSKLPSSRRVFIVPRKYRVCTVDDPVVIGQARYIIDRLRGSHRHRGRSRPRARLTMGNRAEDGDLRLVDDRRRRARLVAGVGRM